MGRPTASPTMLRARAALLTQLRAFFRDRGVMEVDTPVLAPVATPDPHLSPIITRDPLGSTTPAYLQTSPELAMKRLLAAGSGPIYQLGHVFRQEERGRYHQPEFTLLEWYRPGETLDALMNEVTELVALVLGSAPVQRLSYARACREAAGVDPRTADAASLRAALSGFSVPEDETVWLDCLWTHRVEPWLADRGRVLVTEYPASQAALAVVGRDTDGYPVARRFELYVGGVELANGYEELTDAVEQRRRFEAANAARRATGQSVLPLDEAFLTALERGLPASVGVALGVDRLLMLQQGVADIAEVVPCAWPAD